MSVSLSVRAPVPFPVCLYPCPSVSLSLSSVSLTICAPIPVRLCSWPPVPLSLSVCVPGRYARSECLYAALFATFFDVFMPPWATEMFRHRLLLIGVFCVTPASYWSVRGINTNSAWHSVQSVANSPTVNTCEMDLLIFSQRALPGNFKGTVAWDPLCFQKV
jgi:hypothetical protein